ncbi:MAG: hypothetical protein ACHQXG_08360 [Nitrososphaerales archaeon]
MIRSIKYSNKSISVMLLLLSATFPIFCETNMLPAYAYTDIPDTLDRSDVAHIFDFGCGIFAAVLFVLSLIAYNAVRLKRILFVSVAFGLFALHVIFTHLDLFFIELESSLLELILALMSFVALALFFISIVIKEKLTPQTFSS